MLKIAENMVAELTAHFQYQGKTTDKFTTFGRFFLLLGRYVPFLFKRYSPFCWL